MGPSFALHASHGVKQVASSLPGNKPRKANAYFSPCVRTPKGSHFFQPGTMKQIILCDVGGSKGVETLIIIHSLSAGRRSPGATIDCLAKYRSPVRTKYRLGSLCYLTPSRGCRGFAEIVPGCPREIARHSGKRCSIGFQPVFIHTIERCFIPAHKLSIEPRVETLG